MIVKYIHHGMEVAVRRDDLGRHREHCLCYECVSFLPGNAGNCVIAQAIYENCKRFGVVTPVWECPSFEPVNQEPEESV